MRHERVLRRVSRSCSGSIQPTRRAAPMLVSVASARPAIHGTVTSSRFQNSPSTPPGRSTRVISVSASGLLNQ
ncbi:hypothetical protein [Actinokineospora xionganensis]|uniref:hypothetical protein n=1 Tax=Actinokineospora xionganensis TaxID=2684470 RepID=UPI0028AA1347|nr:hypothetical protein [Actinokineospora xionganensis]